MEWLPQLREHLGIHPKPTKLSRTTTGIQETYLREVIRNFGQRIIKKEVIETVTKGRSVVSL